MTDAGNDAAGSGPNQSHGEPGAVTPAQLSEALGSFRQELLTSVNGAITGRLERLDIAGQVKAALEPSADDGHRGNGAAKTASKAPNPELDTLRKQLEASNAELARERKATAIRGALAARGLAGSALEDAAALLAARQDITSEVDATGNRVWSGQVGTDLGPVSKPLVDVVGSYLQERPHLVPAAHRGGTGATGGGSQAGGGHDGTPSNLTDADPEWIEANPDKALELARSAMRKQSQTSPWGS